MLSLPSRIISRSVAVGGSVISRLIIIGTLRQSDGHVDAITDSPQTVKLL
jgi:hypothetical protein